MNTIIIGLIVLLFNIFNIFNNSVAFDIQSGYTLVPKKPLYKIPSNPLKNDDTHFLLKKSAKKIKPEYKSCIRPHYVYDRIINNGNTYSNVVKSISEIGYFNKQELPSETQLQDLPMRTLVWILRDLVLCKLTYVHNDEKYPWIKKICKIHVNDDSINFYNTYNIAASLQKMIDGVELEHRKSNISNHELFFIRRTLEYKEDLNRVNKYLPDEMIIYPEGTNRRMISAYFPDTNVLTFAFRGTDLEESFFEDVYDDTSVILSGKSRRSKKLAQKCKKIIEKYVQDPETRIQTTGHSLGATIALEVALELNCTCVGVNFGAGNKLPRGYADKIAIKNQLVHIHNPNDILSNNILDETVFQRVRNWVFTGSNLILRRKKIQPKKRYQIPTIITNIYRVRRQQIIESGFIRSHSLLNIIYELEEAIVDKIYEC